MKICIILIQTVQPSWWHQDSIDIGPTVLYPGLPTSTAGMQNVLIFCQLVKLSKNSEDELNMEFLECREEENGFSTCTQHTHRLRSCV